MFLAGTSRPYLGGPGDVIVGHYDPLDALFHQHRDCPLSEHHLRWEKTFTALCILDDLGLQSYLLQTF